MTGRERNVPLSVSAPTSWWNGVESDSKDHKMTRSRYIRTMVDLSKRERREEIYMEMRSKIKELEEAVSKAEAIDDEPVIEPTLDDLIAKGRQLRERK